VFIFLSTGKGPGSSYASLGTSGGGGGGHGGRGGRATMVSVSGTAYGAFKEPLDFGK